MIRAIFAVLTLLWVLPIQAATLYIEEFANQPTPQATVIWQAAKTPGLAKQTVAIGGSSAQSAAFTSSTTLIRIESDATCSVEIGTPNPTATATSMRVAAGVPEYFVVNPGDKIAVITNN